MLGNIGSKLLIALLVLSHYCASAHIYAVGLNEDTLLDNAHSRLDNALKVKNWVGAGRAGYAVSSINFDSFNADESIKYSLLGITYSKRGNDVLFEAKNYYGLGSGFYLKFSYSQAMENLLTALKLSEKLNDAILVMQINNKIGMIYKYLEDYDKAMTYLLPAYQQALRLKKGPLADLLVNIGNIKESQGLYNESISYYQKYLELKPNDSFTQVIANNNIGKVYLSMNKPDVAIGYFNKAYSAEDTVANMRGRAYSYNNLARTAEAKGEYHKAITYELKSLQQAQLYNIKSLVWTCYEVLANCYQEIENHQLANLYLKKHLGLKDSIFARQRVDRVSVLDAAYRFETETEKKQQEIASLTDRNRISSLGLANMNKERLLALLKLNNLRQQESLNHLKLDNYQKANLVTSMQLQSLNQKNQVNNLQLSVQNRNMLLLVAGCAILLVVLFIFYRRYRLKKLSEVEDIRSNIAADFHDELGSTLSSIALYSEMALRDDLADAQRTKGILSIIGESSRGTVSAMQDMIWAIQPENDNMSEVINRMREFAFPLAEVKNVNVKLNIAEDVKTIELPMDIRKNVYLIYKESLNNAFKYSSAQNINVNLTKNGGILLLSVVDDGQGFDVATARQGNGLRNIRKRADQAGGKLSIVSRGGDGTQIFFDCPITKS
ncbi:tetratricopeptide repeat-containing sensor histidine kinase [Mucilaginibacter sp. HD30]